MLCGCVYGQNTFPRVTQNMHWNNAAHVALVCRVYNCVFVTLLQLVLPTILRLRMASTYISALIDGIFPFIRFSYLYA